MLVLPETSAGPVVVKISNRAENPAHPRHGEPGAAPPRAVDPALPVPRLLPTADGEHRSSIVDGAGRPHLIRLMTMLPGATPRAGRSRPLAERIGAWWPGYRSGCRDSSTSGRAPARLGHPGPPPRVPPATTRSATAGRRAGPDRAALAATRALPAGVQHADLTLTNLLRDDGDITGVIDFGDMHHTAAVCDLAVSLTSVLRNTAAPRASAVELAAAFLDGYQRRRPLLPEEAAMLGQLVLARLVTTLDISRPRPASIRRTASTSPSTTRAATGCCVAVRAGRRRAGRPVRPADRHATARRPIATAELYQRRDRVLGGPLAPMFYDEPLEIRPRPRARGWSAPTGAAYLDAYNNVAVAGHTHPAINQAVVRQLRTLNTHSRYLHPAMVELAERLTATMPAGLDTFVLVTSGSEAVDLAWRLARAYTGATGPSSAAWAYHGISTRTHDFSPNEWPAGQFAVDDVATFAAPHEDPVRVLDRDAAAARRVAAARGRPGRPGRAARGCSWSTRSSPARASWTRRPSSCPDWSTGSTRPAGCSWPTRCRAASGAAGRNCGGSPPPASPRTS